MADNTSTWHGDKLIANVPSNISFKSKKFKLDQDIKKFIAEGHYNPWDIKDVWFRNLGEDLSRDIKSIHVDTYGHAFSAWLIKDELYRIFELGNNLIIGWEIFVDYNGYLYGNHCAINIKFIFSQPYETEEGRKIRKERYEKYQIEMQRRKAEEERKKLISTYTDLGCANGWSEAPAILITAVNDKTEHFEQERLGREYYRYISHKYKFYYTVDSTD